MRNQEIGKDRISTPPAKVSKWLDRFWLILLVLFLAGCGYLFFSGKYCAYLATDFRGYYASAQIAWKHGFAAVYPIRNSSAVPLQAVTQAALPFRCPDGNLVPPRLQVSVPYLPIFLLPLLSLPLLDFTASYLLWCGINLFAFYLYLNYFSKSLAGRSDHLRLLQWLICIPFLANLTLGQINVFWVICLSEFVRRCASAPMFVKYKPQRNGLWLGGVLLKPHALILLLPGLVVGRQWRLLAGFLANLAILLVGSWLLVGVQGLRAQFSLVFEFAQPSFLSAPAMMNWRALGLNLAGLLPGWAAWSVIAAGMILTAGWVLRLWVGYFRQTHQDPDGFLFLMLASTAGACVVAWHSNLYMQTALIPVLLVLDLKGYMPATLRWVWILGPAVLYGLAFLANPLAARNILGMGLFVFNLVFVVWAGKRVLRGH